MLSLALLIVLGLATVGQVCGYCETGKNRCPLPCECESVDDDGGLRVDCSRKHLIKAPHLLPYETVELLLNNNAINFTEKDDFQNCQLLQLLDLSNNQLERIAYGSFSSLTNLETLYLNDNNLKYDELPNGIFSELTQLSVCYLHNNYDHPTSYPVDFLSGMNELGTLKLDGFPGAHFGDQFSRLSSLKTLHIYGGLDYIHNDTFASFSNSSVEELSLKTRDRLRYVEPNSFSHFVRLKTLDLGYNQGLGLMNASNAWWGLQFTEITKLVLTRIVPADEEAARITRDFFTFLPLTRIETLIIDKNNIVSLEPLLSKAFPHLVHLDIAYNRLTNIASVLGDIMYLTNLTYIDFSRQAKRFANADDNDRVSPEHSIRQESASAAGKPRIENADDWFSPCRTPRFTPCAPSYTYPHNSIQQTIASGNIGKATILPDHGTWCIFGPPHLEILILTESLNVDLRTLPSIVVMRTTTLKRFEYRNNGIENLVMPIVLATPMNLSIDFSDNRMKCLSPDVFNYSTHLGSNIDEFYLSGNNLAQQLERDVNGITFEHLKQTKLLDLSRNGIKLLSVNAFLHTVNLHKLDLSQNFLRTFEVHISHMSRLSVLNISFNLLTTLTPNLTDTLSTIFQSVEPIANLTIDLTGNPLQCSCDTLSSLIWISLNQHHMINFLDYSCWFNGSYVSFSNLNNIILVELNYVCSQRIAVIVSASLCALFLIVIATSVCMYRYKWEVRYWCLWLTNRSRLYRELADETDYEYDALLSYSSVDGNWVREELMPHLETPAINEVNDLINAARPLPGLGQDIGPFRVCDHERDFPLGSDIYENIWAMMERSRKVILIITPSFARSECCDFEMNLARRACFERARNLFVPIILEEPYAADMSDGLRWIVRNLEVFTWPREDCQQEERDEFWYKLRRAVADSGLNLNFHRN